MTDHGGAEIITFYSYKGGTGRSMLLANVAWILASNGKRVLMVDWDLEAPGLHRYFRPFLIDKDLIATDGLIDLVWSFADAAMTPVPDAERAQGWHEAYADLLAYITAVRWSFPLPGCLDLLVAGKQGPSYSRSVNSFNWENFYDRLGGGVFLESLKRRMRSDYDYVLIDSRTGVSDTAGICTVQMPDALVVCFTANNQSIQGCASVAQSVSKQWTAAGRLPARQRILPLLTRIDSSEKDKLDTRRAFARATFDPYVAVIAPDAIDEYWRDIEVPYVPWYSYEEVLSAFADKYREKTSILDSAEALTRVLTRGAVSSVLRPNDDDRERVLKQFAAIGAASFEPTVRPTSDAQLTCPYPGMRAFTADDAGMFFGREYEVDEILGRLRAGEREIYVIGPSGSGKSSLLLAGLGPRLERGVSGLGKYLVRSLRPGDCPAARLSEAIEGEITAPVVAINALLGRHAAGVSMLLIIDQLEELFALASYDERSTFVAALRALRSHSRCVLVFALRADFLDVFNASSLGRDVEGHFSRFDIAPLHGEALRTAVERPVRELGVPSEPDLIERLLDDAGAAPGLLPLLQEALVLLWNQRTGSQIALSDYLALGDGIRNGFAAVTVRRADAALSGLDTAHATMARRILIRLVVPGAGPPDTRRSQPIQALMSEADDGEAFWYVMQYLIDHRLITVDCASRTGGALATLSHDALITAWPGLREWIATMWPAEQQRRRLEAWVEAWSERGRSTGDLLDQTEIAEALQWRENEKAQQLGCGVGLSALVAASQIEITKREQRQRRRRYRATVAVAAFSAIASMVVLAAWQQRREAHHRLGMSYLEQGRALLLNGDPAQSIPYLLAARNEDVDGPVIRMLFGQASRSLPLITLKGHRAPVRAAAFSLDGKRVVTASDDNTVRIWNASTGKPVTRPLEHDGHVTTASFSPDGVSVVTVSRTAQVWNASTGKRVAGPFEEAGGIIAAVFSPDSARIVTASQDQTTRVWDIETGKQVTAPFNHHGDVTAATFSPDGMFVVTASGDNWALVWDVTSGQLVRALEHHGEVTAAAFSPDGTRIVTASQDGAVCIWDATTGAPMTAPFKHEGVITIAAFSADGTRVVTASQNGTVRIWDAATGAPMTAPLKHRGVVTAAKLNPDGTRLVTASQDEARVWDTRTGELVTALLTHQGKMLSATLSSDGKRVVTADEDRTAQVWDATADQAVIASFEHQKKVTAIAYGPEGARMVTASEDRTARVWDPWTGKPLTPPLEHGGSVTAVAFSPVGTRLVTASEDGTARVWDAWTGRPVTPPLQHERSVTAVAFSPDGSRVITTSDDGTARVWDAWTGKPVTPPLQHEGSVTAVAFSPDGTRVATASNDSTARVWDTRTGKPVTPPLKHQDAVVAAAFSPDGREIVTASYDTTAQIWDATTGKPVTAPLKHQDYVYAARFSPDGSAVITASNDKTAQLWDATTGRPSGPALEHQGPVHAAVFSLDGTRVVTASEDRTVRVWDAATGKPCSSPLEHRQGVRNAMLSPDGKLIITMSDDNVARTWKLSFDGGELAQWAATAERSPYLLAHGKLQQRSSHKAAAARN